MSHPDDADSPAIRRRVHDINNALNVIAMQAELVRLRSADSASAAEIARSIDIVVKECAKVGDLAVEISDAVKAETGQ